MSDQTPTSEILNRAADLIEERGWTKGTAGMLVGGPHCALGAIAAASDSSLRPDLDVPTYDYLFAVKAPVEARNARDSLASYLGRDAGNGKVYGWDSEVYGWNDGSTAEQVIEALRACAVIEAAKENADVRESVIA